MDEAYIKDCIQRRKPIGPKHAQALLTELEAARKVVEAVRACDRNTILDLMKAYDTVVKGTP